VDNRTRLKSFSLDAEKQSMEDLILVMISVVAAFLLDFRETQRSLKSNFWAKCGAALMAISLPEAKPTTIASADDAARSVTKEDEIKAQSGYNVPPTSSSWIERKYFPPLMIMLVGITGQFLLSLAIDILLWKKIYYGRYFVEQCVGCLAEVITISAVLALIVFFVCWLIRLAKKRWPGLIIPTVIICLWSYSVIVTSTYDRYNEKLEKAKFEEKYEFVAPLPEAETEKGEK
jgi:hypothetical protein